jgi:hypothetical protein
MTPKSFVQVLEAASQDYLPEDLDLFPHIAEEIKQRQARPALSRPKMAVAALLVVILAFVVVLVSVPAVADAMGRWFGFIPGVGIVEQGAPIRVLAEPVTATRAGVTVTVKQAVLSMDKTVILYTVSGIPASAYPQQEKTVGCYASPDVQLPDGTRLSFSTGGGGAAPGYEIRDVYSAVPANVNTATFLLPCIGGTLPGSLPENWSLPLRFVPAPPDLTVMPVIEVSPSSPATNSIDTPGPAQPLLTLDKVIELADGYTFTGMFHSINLPNGITIDAGNQTVDKLVVTDANGQAIHAESAPDVDFPTSSMNNFPWAIKVSGKQFTWPLTITLAAAQVTLPDQEAKFALDTGNNPQVGQQWVLNQDVEMFGYHGRLVSIQRTNDGYEFVLQRGPQVIGMGAWFDGFHVTGGGGGDDGQGNMTLRDTYDGVPPSGKLTVVVSIQTVTVTGPWSVIWQPNTP